MIRRLTALAALSLALAACHSQATRDKIAAAENGSQPLEPGTDNGAGNAAQPQ